MSLPLMEPSGEASDQDATEAAGIVVFYAAVGQSISAWARMETGLIYMFAFLMGTHPQKAGLVLYSINNFHNWLTLIETLISAEARVTHILSPWNKKTKKLKELNDIRARIAHQYASDDSEQVFGKVLAASSLDIRGKTLRQKPLTLDEIHSFIGDTLRATSEIADTLELIAAAIGRAPSPATSPQQADQGQTAAR